MKEEYLTIFFVSIIIIAIILLITINSNIKNLGVKGESYSNYNVITYDDFDTLTEEYCDVYIAKNPDREEDFFNEHNRHYRSH